MRAFVEAVCVLFSAFLLSFNVFSETGIARRVGEGHIQSNEYLEVEVKGRVTR